MIKKHQKTERVTLFHTGWQAYAIYIFTHIVWFDCVRDVNSQEDRMQLQSTHNAFSARRNVRLNWLTYRMNIHKNTHIETDSGLSFLVRCFVSVVLLHTQTKDHSLRSAAIKTD